MNRALECILLVKVSLTFNSYCFLSLCWVLNYNAAYLGHHCTRFLLFRVTCETWRVREKCEVFGTSSPWFSHAIRKPPLFVMNSLQTVSNLGSAPAVWFLILALCEISTSNFDRWIHRPASIPLSYETLGIHFKKS